MRFGGIVLCFAIALSTALHGTETSVAELEKLAKAGDVNAQLHLASRYDFGRGVRQNRKKAAHWYERAALAGNAMAQNNLGSLYLEGSGVKQDYASALKFFRAAADQGEPNAQCSLGLMIENGWGTPKNLGEAIGWYRKAADGGLPQAMQNLALFYSNGDGVEKNDAEAVHWLGKAADAGFGPSQWRLGLAHDQGLLGLPENPERAVALYRKAAAQESIEAAIAIGVCYAQGRGVEKDLIEAYAWLEICRAATQTFPTPSPNLNQKWSARRELATVMKQLDDAQVKRGNERARALWIELYRERFQADPPS